MIDIKHVTKSYEGKQRAVDDVSLTIDGGLIYGFIGHNGAGKTTLLRSMAGIIDFEGDITLNGHSIKDAPLEAKKHIAYIPDNPDVYESLKGIEYLDFMGDVFDVPGDKRERLINEYTRQFEIDDVLGNPIASYSHGMKQKIVITGALIHEPSIMLLDEPFVGLDPKASHQLKTIFRSMCDDGGLIFFSTHVLEVAEKLCDQVAIIKQGKIVAEGKTKDVIKDQSLEHLFLELIEEKQ